MEQIGLDTAISHIQQACAPGGRSPFFFVVGAGISSPSVPLASEVESRCREIAKKWGRTGECPSDRAVDRYSHWFGTALPQPAQRQEFLRDLIDRKPITLPNFQLAHLLLTGCVSNLVVTPNFDDFLSRALALFGKTHISCDQPYGVDRIDPESSQVQIVHVHGTYKFYDCANLTGEIRGAARRPENRAFSMPSLLDGILYRRAPIVLGYSGWEGDAIMTSLERRLKEAVGYNVYWFCYRAADINLLPEWVRIHPNVQFVVPPKAEAAVSRVDPESAQTAGRAREGQSEVPTLAAHQVLGALIRKFDLPTPELVVDPLGFLARQLEDSLPKGEEAASRAFLDYSLNGALDLVRRAIRLLSHEEAAPLAALRDAMGRQQYQEAVQAVEPTRLEKLNDADLLELIGKMYSAARGLNDNSSWEERACDAAIAAAEELVRRGSDALVPGEEFGWVLFSKAYLLAARDEYDAAYALLDRVVARYGGSPEPPLRKRVAWSLYNKAVYLGNNQQWKEAVAVCDDVLHRFESAGESSLREVVAWTLAHKSDALRALTDKAGAIGMAEIAIERFRNATEPAVQEPIAYVMVNRGNFLASVGRLEEALAAYQEAVSLYDGSSEPGVQNQVARARMNRALKLRSTRPEDAAKVCMEIEQRYADSKEPALENYVQQARRLMAQIRKDSTDSSSAAQSA